MARRRGFLAELQQQARLVEQQANATARRNAARERAAETDRKRMERQRAAQIKATEAEKKKALREADLLYREERTAETEFLNDLLQQTYQELDSLLIRTLEVDDFVDLTKLKKIVTHPPFDAKGSHIPTAPPVFMQAFSAPVFSKPDPVRALFGKKRKQAAALKAATQNHERLIAEWEEHMRILPIFNAGATDEFRKTELLRNSKLDAQHHKYREECASREKEVAAHNGEVDSFIANLSYGAVEAVQEYVDIVLANSRYPEGFSISHESSFDPGAAELQLTTLVPEPSSLPSIKSYRYVRSSDEILESQLSQKDQKDRYADVLNQIALRTLHEVFESDRSGVIRSISLTIRSRVLDPATGRRTTVPFIAVASAREQFLDLELRSVVPAAALEHLGASISKNPWGLVPAVVSGVRKTGA